MVSDSGNSEVECWVCEAEGDIVIGRRGVLVKCAFCRVGVGL